MMEISPVSSMLAVEGFGSPTLNVLQPNEKNYTALLMQPKGEVEGSAGGVRNKDRPLAQRQFSRFLEDAHETDADLVITPEYSMPWDILSNATKTEVAPRQGKLWALGCESIKYSELDTLKKDLAPFATVLYEPLVADPGRFTDPLAYVFLAPKNDGNDELKIVVLIQFKTFPMADDDHFEINGLQRGTRVYQFGTKGDDIRLMSLICSDALDFKDTHAKEIYNCALVIHIQLNKKPRQALYRKYRDRLLQFKGDTTELICLNWARDVHEWCGQVDNPWCNIAGSAWYLRPDDFDERDETLCKNHRRGLYYTWLEPLRSHALFFNYDAATYLLTATKVAHIGVSAAVSRRRGPQLTRTCTWDNKNSTWAVHGTVEDGFSALVGESGHAKDEIKRIATNNPLAAERVLALCAGKIGHSANWHSVRQLDSCVIGESEVVHRLTFCQDTDTGACEFRVRRLKRCGHLWGILEAPDKLPPALADLRQGFRFDWSPDFPHQNALSTSGKRATVIYMGEESSLAQVEAVFKFAAAFLQREFSEADDESHDARQRLAVWYRDNRGEIELYDRDRFNNFDSAGNAPELDIGRET